MNILIYKNDQQAGPFSLDEVHAMLDSEEILITDLGWVDGMTDWKPIKEIIPLKQPPARLTEAEITSYRTVKQSSKSIAHIQSTLLPVAVFLAVMLAIISAFLVIKFGEHYVNEKKKLAAIQEQTKNLRIKNIQSGIVNLLMQTVYSSNKKMCADSFIENKKIYSSLKKKYDDLEPQYKNGTRFESDMRDMEVFFNEETHDSVKMAAFSEEVMNVAYKLKNCIERLHLNEGADVARLNDSSGRDFDYYYYRPELAYDIRDYKEMKRIYLSKYKPIIDECMKTTKNAKTLNAAKSINNKISEIDALLIKSDAENAEKKP